MEIWSEIQVRMNATWWEICQTIFCAHAEACSCLGAEFLKISKIHMQIMPLVSYCTRCHWYLTVLFLWLKSQESEISDIYNAATFWHFGEWAIGIYRASLLVRQVANRFKLPQLYDSQTATMSTRNWHHTWLTQHWSMTCYYLPPRLANLPLSPVKLISTYSQDSCHHPWIEWSHQCWSHQCWSQEQGLEPRRPYVGPSWHNTIDNIAAGHNTIDNIAAGHTTIDNIAAGHNTIDNIAAGHNTIDNIAAGHNTIDNIAAGHNTIDNIAAGHNTIDNIAAGHNTIDNIAAGHNTIDNIAAGHNTIDNIAAGHNTIDNIAAGHNTIDNIAAGHTTIDNIAAGHNTIDNIAAGHNTIDNIAAGHNTIDNIAAGHNTTGDRSSLQMGSFTCIIPRTGWNIPRPLLHQSWNEK